MEQRKYFRHRVTDLEDLYSKANGDSALLEELEEELVERDTQRAKRLLESVRKSLEASSGSAKAKASTPSLPSPPPPSRAGAENTPVSKAPIALPVEDGKPIDWEEFLSSVAEEHANSASSIAIAPLTNSAQSIIDTWTALEALSPQTYKRPDDLVIGTGSVAYFRNGEEPWLSGERSRPRHNLFYLVYLGAIDLEQATEKLLKTYQDKRVERPRSCCLAAHSDWVGRSRPGSSVPQISLS